MADPDISVAMWLSVPQPKKHLANRLGAIGDNQLTGRLQFFISRASPVRWLGTMILLVAMPWGGGSRSEEHTSELQSLMRISYAVFCLKTKKLQTTIPKASSLSIPLNTRIYYINS